MHTKKAQAILDDEKFWPFWVTLLEQIHIQEMQKKPAYLSGFANIFYDKHLKTHAAIRKWTMELGNRGLITEQRKGRVLYYSLTPLGKEFVDALSRMRELVGSDGRTTKNKVK
jgi:predicted transcriptional regulator